MDDLEVRVGDGERWAVDARLQQAVGDGQLTLAEYEERAGEVWRARTRGELDVTTRDLPGVVPAPGPAPKPTGRPPRTRRAVAVLSGDELSGPVAPGQGVEAYALMGGATLDLRRDDLPAEVRVRAVAVMGGIEVLVPRGVSVHLSGLSLMGGRDCHLDPPRPGAPVVNIQAYAVMGGVDVGHGRETGSRPAAREPVSLSKTSPGGLAPAESSRREVRSRARPHRRGRGRSFSALALIAVLVGGAYVASQPDGAAVFGSTEHQVSAGETHVKVGTLFGSVKVVVPDNAQVTMGGVVVFGSAESRVDGSGDGPHVTVDGVGAFGSVEVVTQTQDRKGES